jgi:histone H3/H4
MRIEDTTTKIVSDLWAEVKPLMGQAATLEEAAQHLVSTLYKSFKESVVLTRMFITTPLGELPDQNEAFVGELADSAGAKEALKRTTPVLSLVGTHGQEGDWCDRRQSKGHVGIPVISSSFLDAIPMISRLLKELGVPVSWVDSHDSEIIVKAIGNAAGLFFVRNAAEATDQQGRKIITAQDFVSEYGVKSVFGLGGAYRSGQMLVIVVFCRDEFDRSVAERFLSLVSFFATKTAGMAESKNIFAAST